MPKYHVYVEQVYTTKVEVEAESPMLAVRKAIEEGGEDVEDSLEYDYTLDKETKLYAEDLESGRCGYFDAYDEDDVDE